MGDLLTVMYFILWPGLVVEDNTIFFSVWYKYFKYTIILMPLCYCTQSQAAAAIHNYISLFVSPLEKKDKTNQKQNETKIPCQVPRILICPYSQKRNNFHPGISLPTQTWFIFCLFCKLILPAQNDEQVRSIESSICFYFTIIPLTILFQKWQEK